jgi:hypothetical protein
MWANCLENMEASISHNLIGLHGLLQGELLHSYMSTFIHYTHQIKNYPLVKSCLSSSKFFPCILETSDYNMTHCTDLLSTCDWLVSHILLQTRPSFKFHHCLTNINFALWSVMFQERLGQRMKQRESFVEPVTARTRLDRVVLQMNVTEQKTEPFHRHKLWNTAVRKV